MSQMGQLAADLLTATLVVGADGMIGHALLSDLTWKGLPVVGSSRAKPSRSHSQLVIDLSQSPSTWKLPAKVSTAYICAGIASIDRCAREPQLTHAINCEGTIALAKLLADRGALVVYLSSNQVFDGAQPHRSPTDRTCPRTHYGKQKAYTEEAILSLGNQGAVVRLTKVLPAGAPLLEGWRRSLLRGEAIHPFDDMVMAPVSLDRVVEVIEQVGRERRAGITQVSGAKDISYAQAALHIARRLGADERLVQPVSARSAGLSADATPHYTSLRMDIRPAQDAYAVIDGVLGLTERVG